MESFSKKSVILIPFPFSDLSQSKMRPAIILADVGRNDFLLCQVTSNPYGDPSAVKLESEDFSAGSLQVTSFARPGKLFSANKSIFSSLVGHLNDAAMQRIISSIVELLTKD